MIKPQARRLPRTPKPIRRARPRGPQTPDPVLTGEQLVLLRTPQIAAPANTASTQRELFEGGNTVSGDASTQGPRRDFVLDEASGRRIVYQLPEDRITMAEAHRFTWHLVTMCRDFNPGSMAQLLSAMKQMEEQADRDSSGYSTDIVR